MSHLLLQQSVFLLQLLHCHLDGGILAWTVWLHEKGTGRRQWVTTCDSHVQQEGRKPETGHKCHGSRCSFGGEAKQRQCEGYSFSSCPSPPPTGARPQTPFPADSSVVTDSGAGSLMACSGQWPAAEWTCAHSPPYKPATVRLNLSDLYSATCAPTCRQGSHASRPHPKATPTVAGRPSISQRSSPDAGDCFCEFPSNDKGSACPDPAGTGEAPGDSAESGAGK